MMELKFIRPYVKRYGLQYLIGIAALLLVDALNVTSPALPARSRTDWKLIRSE